MSGQCSFAVQTKQEPLCPPLCFLQSRGRGLCAHSPPERARQVVRAAQDEEAAPAPATPAASGHTAPVARRLCSARCARQPLPRHHPALSCILTQHCTYAPSPPPVCLSLWAPLFQQTNNGNTDGLRPRLVFAPPVFGALPASYRPPPFSIRPCRRRTLPHLSPPLYAGMWL